MAKKIMWFRRDLRVDDNTALLMAARADGDIIPVFVLDEQLLERWRDATPRTTFLFESLHELAQAISRQGGRLIVRRGKPAEVLAELAREVDADELYFNRDYTPLARRRDRGVRDQLREAGVTVTVCDDALLNSPEAVLKADGSPYSVFTPYYKLARQSSVARPAGLPVIPFADQSLVSLPIPVVQSPAGLLVGGRRAALDTLDAACSLADYETERDQPGVAGTSKLAAYLRLGLLSPREVYHALAARNADPAPLLRQLYWRDFYAQVAYHHPHVFSGAFRRQYNAIRWQSPGEQFQHWCAGTTGFPIVDAGMRELVATGWMHNRVRMVVASFLVKNLHISWRHGEAFFARYLVDYDPAANNGNWQWCASTGCDAQPYFRVFNPWRQQQKFDPDCVYIHKWLPELREYPARQIHTLEKHDDFYLPKIVDLKLSAQVIKDTFKAVRSGD